MVVRARVVDVVVVEVVVLVKATVVDVVVVVLDGSNVVGVVVDVVVGEAVQRDKLLIVKCPG